MAADVQLKCPIHGDVEGVSPSEGPLSECWPWVLLCEHEHDDHEVIVGYEWHDQDSDHNDGSQVSTRWEDAPYA